MNKRYWTRTQEDFNSLMEEFEKKQYRWQSGRSPLENKHLWETYGKDTCVKVREVLITYDSVAYLHTQDFEELEVHTANKIKAPQEEEPKKTHKDNINPSHYTQGKYETIDIILDRVENLPGNQSTLVGNIIKYLWRYDKKNGVEDLNKSKWYLDKLIEVVDDESKKS